jgi:hypothetical protein
MDEDKLGSVRAWPAPTCVKEVQRFLGFANFYRRFIFNFSGLAAPLTKLLRTSSVWKWGTEERNAFEGLKKAFTSAPVLRQFDEELVCTVETDASDYAIAAVASQRFPEKNRESIYRPVGFFSRKLKDAEINYTVHDKELLAIVESFKHWKPNLVGNRHRIEVITDHRNLEYFQTKKQLNRRQARWAEELADFNFGVRYRAGKRGTKPDTLTRRPDYHPGRGATKENEFNPGNFTALLPKELFMDEVDEEDSRGCRGMVESLLEEVEEEIEVGKPLLEDVLDGYREDEGFKDYFKDWPGPNLTVKDGSVLTWSETSGLRDEGKLLVPDWRGARRRVLEARHDNLLAGHPGRDKTIELVSRDYTWPGMVRFCEDYVAGCATCQRTKSKRHKP